MARTNWSKTGWTNQVKMKCPMSMTVCSVSGKDASQGGVGCKKPSCRGVALDRA
jgi:hypothetical protein